MFKYSKNIFVITIFTFLTYMSLMMVITVIPVSPIYKNIKSVINNEEMINYPHNFLGQIDFWTECVMYGVVLNSTSNINIINNPTYGNCAKLKNYILNNKPITYNYNRYLWGDILFSKPLLYFINPIYIKYIIFIITFSLILVCLNIIIKNLGCKIGIIFISSFFPILSSFASIFSTFNHAIPFWITLCGIYVIIKNNIIKNIDNVLIFIYLGSLTALFNFTVSPLLELTFPLLFLFITIYKKYNIILKLRTIFVCCFVFIFSMFLVIFYKFMLITILEGNIDNFVYLLNRFRGGHSFIVTKTISGDMYILLSKINKTLFILLFSLYCIFSYANKENIISNICKNIKICYIGILPILFTIINHGHSAWHAWFMSTAFITPIFCLLYIVNNHEYITK